MNFSKVASVSLLTAAFGISLMFASEVEALIQAQATTSSAARMCTLCDFGQQAGGPLWPQQVGRMAAPGDGYLYSTSPQGGRVNNQGTIFRVHSKTGALDVLYNFDFSEHGGGPMSGLVQGKGGALYGTTFSGGQFVVADNGAKRGGTGTLFRYTIGASAPEVIHTFRNGDLGGIKPEICPEKQPCRYSLQQRLNAAGGYPVSTPILASDGEMYGVAAYSLNQQYGVLYKVVPYKGESAITALCIGGDIADSATAAPLTDAQLRERCMFSGANGNYPMTLIAGGPGELYGTTWGGGAATPNGTIFKASLAGKVQTLHNFTDATTGSHPHSIIRGSDGYIYGATANGGLSGIGNPGYGVVFRIGPSGFEVLHRLNGTTEGIGPLAGLAELQLSDGKTYFYGAVRGNGREGRGVLYRIDTSGTFEVVYDFPAQWQAAGRIPSTALLAAKDPDMGPVVYGMTYQGGPFDAGTVYRLSGLELPRIADLTVIPTFTTGTLATPRYSVTIPGQLQQAFIEVHTGVIAGQPTPIKDVTDNGIKINTFNCRNPHVLQFVSREKIRPDGLRVGGTFTLSNGVSYAFTTDPNNRVWHTDTPYGPNPYYDQNPKVARIVGGLGLTIFDQPSFPETRLEDISPGGSANFVAGAPETWRAVFKDYVMCNCKVIAEIQWSREVPWIVDLPTAPDVTVNINKGHHGKPVYGPVTITTPSDPNLDWANAQLARDGFIRVP